MLWTDTATSAVGGRLCLGQGQELIQQASAALDPLAQDRQPFARQAGHFRFRQPFRLQRHGGQRRAQLVRGIRHKAALRFHRLADTGEQPIDRHGERTHLDRKVAVFDGMQFLLGPLVDFLDSAAMGRNILRTRSATINSSTGTRIRKGITVRSAPSRAISLRKPDS
jgi:hypothetical protein